MRYIGMFRVYKICLLAASLFIVSALLSNISRADQVRSDTVVLTAMEQELKRSQNKLKLGDYDPLYYISYQIKDNEYTIIHGKYGAILSSDKNRTRRLFVDVRVGDYEFDNSIRGRSGGKFPFHDASYIPIDNDPDAIKTVLWQVTDYTYKEALKQYFNKKADSVQEVKVEEIPSFTKEKTHVYYGPQLGLEFNEKKWEENIRDISSVYKEYKELLDSSVTITAQKETVYFVNSEGSRYIRDEILYSIDAEAVARTKDGKTITNTRSMYFVSNDEIPTPENIKKELREMMDETIAMSNAAPLQPLTVPVLLEPEAAGVVFHEALGHRLEGERQIDDNEGQTFKEKVGKKIIPEFLSMIDDPTLGSYNGTHLMGMYPFDDQGVPGQRVVLIENGVLKNFLMSRTPVNGFDKSNGHGRSSYGRAPMARMSNTIIESDNQYSKQELKKLLLEEVKKQNKPFGLIIKKMRGGETNTSSYNFQAFRATPIVIYKVDPDTGEETPVRDIEIVGTPLVSVNKIVATGDDYGIFNGFCGAESGYVPVSTVAPSILVSEMEFQRTSSKKEKHPLLPPPFFD